MENKDAAKKFREYWIFRPGSEKGEDQQFWNSLLRDVLGLEDIESAIKYQLPVKLKATTKFLDAWIPSTRVLIEHKTRGVKLDAPQAGHGGMTAYEQAKEYDDARGFDEKARWIVLCNFDEFLVYDCTKPLAAPERITLADLPKEVHRLSFLVNKKVSKVDSKELEISVQAGRIVAKLYDALLKQYESGSPETLAALNRLCVRLVFCLYAEDAGIFPKNALRNLIKSTPVEFMRRQLLRLFQTLDTPPEKRDRYLEAELAVFPYTNGGLFAGASESEIPPLTDEIVKLLDGSSGFDWSGISPTIFGALFESTLNPQTRRAGGMVYTSVENIHKVINPLFMDGLTARVDELLGNVANVQVLPAANTNSQLETGIGNWQHSHNGNIQQGENSALQLQLKTTTKKKLLALQDEMASLTFLDPACGSGNFLTETYLSMRRLENRIIAALQGGQSEFDLGEGIGAKVSIHQFKGIEINDFAVSVAKTAMWIAEAKMHAETCDILHSEPDFLPLKEYDGIVQGNALRLDWPQTNYIMGNPPFVGASMMTAEQKAEAVAIFGKGKRVNSIDYVGAWYHKAAKLIEGTETSVAFVSSNSITQGEQVAPLWQPLIEKYGIEIDFAYRTFRWDNEAQAKAHVHCVIVGFSFNAEAQRRRDTQRNHKRIFDGDKVIEAANINPYLMDGPSVFIESCAKPLCNAVGMTKGNYPTDDGNFILTEKEREAIVRDTPELSTYIRRYVGARDFINNDAVRYCLWLKDASPAVFRKNHEVMCRIEAVRNFRLKSTAAPTRKMAEQPWRFFSTPHSESNYLLLPEVSSERRDYIPIGFMPPAVIAANTCLILPSATLYHFGVLTSSVHMAWMRTVCGRLKSDYRYSGAIVYNNFPWPEIDNVANVKVLPTANANSQLETGNIPTMATLEKTSRTSRTSREIITSAAQAILDARALYPDSSLADLYDPLTMPIELRKAHAANDRAVLAAYGLAPDTPEPEIVAHLFSLYSRMIKGNVHV